jgi:ribosomal 50S subunit-recycling heat shock protein
MTPVRVDLLLKSLCLAKTRSQAHRGCDAGGVSVNGRKAKPSTEVKAGDVVEIRHPRAVTAVEILEVPAGQVSRKDRDRYLRVIRENRIDAGDGEEWDV